MATEVERKFLVTGTGWQQQSTNSYAIRQAYLAFTDAATIRVRIIDGMNARLTIKSANPGAVRSEFEYPVPVRDAEELFRLRTGLIIEKRRYVVPAGSLQWEVDVFEGVHQGLVIAEIELPRIDTTFDRPEWLGAEVTGDARYYNSLLAAGDPDRGR